MKKKYILDRLKKIKFAKLEFYSNNIEKDYFSLPSKYLLINFRSLLASINTPNTKSQLRKFKKLMEISDNNEDTKRSNEIQIIVQKKKPPNVMILSKNLERPNGLLIVDQKSSPSNSKIQSNGHEKSKEVQKIEITFSSNLNELNNTLES